jgi:hypothetical protein
MRPLKANTPELNFVSLMEEKLHKFSPDNLLHHLP